jgi:hypothetical protein
MEGLETAGFQPSSPRFGDVLRVTFYCRVAALQVREMTLSANCMEVMISSMLVTSPTWFFS